MVHTITSFGSDGMKGPDPQEPGVVRRAEEDLIWANGTWLQKPESSTGREERRAQPTWWEAGVSQLPEGFDYRIDEVKTEGKQAETKVILTIDGKQYEQQVSMLDDFGAGWRIVSVGRPLLLPEQPGQEEATTGRPGAFGTEAIAGGDEQEVRRTMEAFLAAFKAVDITRIKEFLTGESLEDFERSVAYLEENQEQLAQAREESARAIYEIVNVKLNPEDNEAEVLLKMIRSPESPSPDYYLAKLRLEAGRWKIYDQGPAEAERREEEIPEYETPEEIEEQAETEIPIEDFEGPQPEESSYILVAGDIERPEFIPVGPKIYPQRARMLKKNGYVMLELKISKTGETVSIDILDEQPPDFGFGNAAKLYFEQGSWKPAKRNGEPVDAIYRFRFDYVLQ
jgi:TonB family protein